jgi:hypothetical protein
MLNASEQANQLVKLYSCAQIYIEERGIYNHFANESSALIASFDSQKTQYV